jgi:hypothetical protein
MSVYVKNGTPLHGASLCENCVHAHIVKGYRESETIAVCTYVSPAVRVTFPVRECTSHIDKTREPLYEMKKVAWELMPRGGKRQAGFVAPGTEGDETPDEIELIFSNKKK